MDGARDHLLARAGLPGDDDARLARRDLLDQVHRLAHRGRLADETHAGVDLAQAAPQHLHLVLGLPLLQRALGDHLEAGGIERLLDEVKDALAHRLHGRVDGALSRDDDHGRIRRFLAQRAGERQAVELRHHQVADDDVGVPLGSDLQGVVAVARLLHVVAPALEQLGKDFARRSVVVHDEDAGLEAADGGRLDGHGAVGALPRMREGEREAGGRRRCKVGRQLGRSLGRQAAHRFQVRCRVVPAGCATLGAELETGPRTIGSDRDVQRAVARQRHCREESVADEIGEERGIRLHRDRGRTALHHGHGPAPRFVTEQELRARDRGAEVGRQMRGRGEIGERLEKRVDPADSVAQRLQVPLGGGSPVPALAHLLP